MERFGEMRQTEGPSEQSSKVYDQYIENREKIKKIMSYRKEFQKNFGNKGTECLEGAFRIMMSQMDKLMTVDSVRPSPQDCTNVKAALNILQRIIVFEPMTKFVKDLTLEFSRLVYNWSRFIGKRKDVEMQSQSLIRIVNNAMTMQDAIEVMKQLTRQLKNQLRYTPPAFELSKHYLRSLEEN